MQVAMDQLSGRWKILLLWYIHSGLNRFGLIKKRLANITTKMLSQQLKELEQNGLIIKTVYPETPPRTEYSLSEKGKSLLPILQELNAWGLNERANSNQLVIENR